MGGLDYVDTARGFAESADEKNFDRTQEAVHIAMQWAQERLDAFLADIERNGNDHKLLKISYIISRRTSVDVFLGKKSDIGEFIGGIIGKLVEGKIKESLADLSETVISKLLGAASGSAQVDKIYEITFDELGGLNRLDAMFFCYRFASSGVTDFSKAVIGTCIVRSAAAMVDDNAYRVVLTNSATLTDTAREHVGKAMVAVAKKQTKVLDEDRNLMDSDPQLLEAQAILAQKIGEGVASSEQFQQRKNRPNGWDTTNVFKRNTESIGAATEAQSQMTVSKTAKITKLKQEGEVANEVVKKVTKDIAGEADSAKKDDSNDSDDED